jgi:tripartite ATP-independent transporter DctP family solute receptor
MADMSHTTRKRLILGATAATALVLAGCGGGDAETTGDGGDAAQPGGGGESQEFVFAYEGPDTTAQGIAADIFQEAVEGDCEGMTIRQYPAAQLGGEPELLEKVRAGDLDFIISSTANAAAIAPESGVFSLHYLVGSADEAIAVFGNEDVNQAYKDMAAEKVQGAQPLTLFTLPLRNIYGNEEIHSVDDVKGKKVRVQATKTEDAIWGAYGAQPVHMAFPEVYSAMQTGVVDLAENAVTYYGLNKHYEVAPIMSMTEHEANGQVIWVSDETWEGLSAEQQECVTAAADVVRTEQPTKAFELQEELQQEYSDLGVQFVTDVDKESFQEISVPMQDEVAQDLGEHAVNILEAIRAVTEG